MWVHVEKVPLHMYSWEGFSFITSTVGFPVKLHPETIACTNLLEAKVFVNVDVSKVLPKNIRFTKDGKSFTVDYYYPWLPARCNLCEKWGHSEAVCAVKGKGKKRKETNGSPSSKDSSRKASPEDGRDSSMRNDNPEDGRKVKESVIEGIGEGRSGGSELRTRKQINSEEVTKSKASTPEGGQESDWSRVSPGKMG